MPKRVATLESLVVIPETKRRRKNLKRATASTTTNAEPDRLSQIYHVAARLFCERGFDATSMEEIASTIGVTKAAVYHFIPGGKKDLLYDVISFGMDTLEREVLTPARMIEDPRERLEAIVSQHAKLVMLGSTKAGYNHVTVVVDEVAGLSPTHRRKIVQRKRAYVDLVYSTLRELQQAGQLQEVDLTVASFCLFGTVLWLARWYRPDGKLSSAEVTQEIVKLVTGGILQKPLS